VSGLTVENPAHGVVIAQPARGFRYTSDAMWLVGFALDGPRATRALDLGTGSGVMAMLLAAHGVPTVGIDLEPAWEAGWRETLAKSTLPVEVELRHGDLREGVGGPYGLVVANPPFFAAGAGPGSPDPWRRAARTESGATLADFLSVGCGALAEAGRMCVIVPREREDEVLAGPLPADRWVRIGRRRSLFGLSAGRGRAVAPESYAERDPQVVAWVHTATHPVGPTRGGGTE
jgi:tRNA1(Val) A37 N6-methylase TrmN6